jgi:large subunit ribosomal protein L22
MPYQASYPIFKLVYSEAKNANHNMGLNKADLFISKAEVNRSTIKKKDKALSQERSYPIKRSTSHKSRTQGKKPKSSLNQSIMSDHRALHI